MDIHRSRFVPYPPSAINALAFSHSENEPGKEDPASLRLAVGRVNGNIEIWNPHNGSWYQERVFSGGKDRSVEGLVWTQEQDDVDERRKVLPGRLRLFSIGYSSSVTEWDMITGLPARHSDGNHSEVWCLAAQPKLKIPAKNDRKAESYLGQNLVAGCADGSLVLLTTADNDLRFDKFLARSPARKTRVLSVTYKDRNTALAGFADSTIRVYDTRNGRVLRNISLGSGPPGGPKDILVWKVKCLSNGDFVTGDSTGDIRIYDGKNFSQLQRISGHEADILDLAVSRDGTMIFSGGMDRRTCFYTCNKKSGAARAHASDRWRKVSHKRYHDHDVKAMATFEGNSLNVIVSGGIDTQPIVLPLRRFGRELSRGLPALPHVPPLVSAPQARLLVSWWNTEVRIWRVKQQEGASEKPIVVARLALRGEENITSLSVTPDGGLLAVATAAEVKLFQLIPAQPSLSAGLRIRKLGVPSTGGAKLVRFSSGGRWLAMVSASNNIELARIIRSTDASDHPRVIPRTISLQRLSRQDMEVDPLNGPRGQYRRAITHADFSTDVAIFAVADVAGYVDTWVLAGHEDSTAPEIDIDVSSPSVLEKDEDDSEDEAESQQQITILGQQWIRNPSGHLIPRLDSPPLLLSFQPTADESAQPLPNGNPAVHPTRHNPHPRSHELPKTENNLLLVSADHQVYEFEVLAGRLSQWSRRNPPSSYPEKFRKLDDPVKGCIWDVANGRRRIWLHGEKWLFMFDQSQDLPLVQTIDGAQRATDHAGDGSTKKRKREATKQNARKKTSGAGDVVQEYETTVTKVRTLPGGKSDQVHWINLNNGDGNAESEEELDSNHQALATLRRAAGHEEFVNEEADVDEAGVEDVGGYTGRAREPWWCTFKYRPILGMVPIGEGSDPLEVVLVERPSWDFNLPPRFVNSHD